MTEKKQEIKKTESGLWTAFNFNRNLGLYETPEAAWEAIHNDFNMLFNNQQFRGYRDDRIQRN